jgi:hypothetical protein
VDGRPGLVRGTRLEDSAFGCVVHTSKTVYHGRRAADPPAYFFMLQKVLDFFGSGLSPLPIEETFQIAAFLEAAEKSRRLQGRAVELETI